MSLMGAIMRKAVLATAALISLAAIRSAGAADMPLKAPAPVPIYDWTGFFIGGSWGTRLSDADWTTTCLQPGLAPCPTAFPARFGFQNSVPLNSTGARWGG